MTPVEGLLFLILGASVLEIFCLIHVVNELRKLNQKGTK